VCGSDDFILHFGIKPPNPPSCRVGLDICLALTGGREENIVKVQRRNSAGPSACKALYHLLSFNIYTILTKDIYLIYCTLLRLREVIHSPRNLSLVLVVRRQKTLPLKMRQRPLVHHESH
jgi:hypothetical protein